MARGYSSNVPIDTISGSLLILEPSHGAVHDGIHYTATWEGTTATSLNTLITVGTSTNGWIHFVAEVEATKQFRFELWEAPTATGGTALTSYNNKRTNTTTSPLTIAKNPTVTTVGTTLLEGHRIGSGRTVANVGGGAAHRNEWLLKPSTKYLIRGTAVSAGTIINFIFPYYYRK